MTDRLTDEEIAEKAAGYLFYDGVYPFARAIESLTRERMLDAVCRELNRTAEYTALQHVRAMLDASPLAEEAAPEEKEST